MTTSRLPSLIDFFEKNAGEYSQTKNRYHVAGTNFLIGPYNYIFYHYAPNLSATRLKEEIALLKKEANIESKLQESELSNLLLSSSLETNAAGQNALHYLFTGKAIRVNRWYQYSSIQFDSHPDRTPFVDPKTRTELSWRQVQIDNPKLVNEIFQTQTEELLDALLTIFPDTPEGNTKLHAALIQQESITENTVLHSAFKNNLIGMCHPLLTRISHMSLEEKLSLASARDVLRKTIFHYALKQCDFELFKLMLNTFEENSLIATFKMEGVDKQTLLHEVCLSTQYGASKAAIIEKLCSVLNSSLSTAPEVKEPGEPLPASVPLQHAFQKNKTGLSPLHLIFYAKTLDTASNVDMIRTMGNALGESLIEKVVEGDDKGWNALHHAIHSKNPAMVEELLNRVNPVLQEWVILQRDTKKETALHHAMRVGNLEILRIILKRIDNTNLYELHVAPDFKQIVAASHIKVSYRKHIEEHLSAFLFTQHFIDNAYLEANKDSFFALQLQDGVQCITAKLESKELAPEDKQFYQSKTLSYHDHRLAFKEYATAQELKECQLYFQHELELSFEQRKPLMSLFNKDNTLEDNSFPLKIEEDTRIEGESVEEKAALDAIMQPTLSSVPRPPPVAPTLQEEKQPHYISIYPDVRQLDLTLNAIDFDIEQFLKMQPSIEGIPSAPPLSPKEKSEPSLKNVSLFSPKAAKITENPKIKKPEKVKGRSLRRQLVDAGI